MGNECSSGAGDDVMLSEDRNQNANGARLILGLASDPGTKLPAIVEAMKSGQVKALVALGEKPTAFGVSSEQLSQLPAFVVMDILSNETTECATALLPGFGFAEKRGSMINGECRLQRLNRPVRGPGNSRDAWEMFSDLLHTLRRGNGI